jgi:hypothetical protein
MAAKIATAVLMDRMASAITGMAESVGSLATQVTSLASRIDGLEQVATTPVALPSLPPLQPMAQSVPLETLSSTLTTLLDGVPMKGRQSGLKWKYCAYHHETGIIVNLQKYFPEATPRAVHDVLVAKVKSGEIQVDEWWTIRTAKMIDKARKRTAPFTHKVETAAFVQYYASK